MQIDVSHLLKSPIGSIQNYQVNETIDIAGVQSMVRGEVKLMRTDHGILVEGRLYSEIEASCSRCLSLFQCPMTINIEEEFFPITDVVSGAPLSPTEEPECFTIDESHVLT